MNCKRLIEPKEDCINASWVVLQERILNRYYFTGDRNALDNHIKYLDSKGWDAVFISEITWKGFRLKSIYS